MHTCMYEDLYKGIHVTGMHLLDLHLNLLYMHSSTYKHGNYTK